MVFEELCLWCGEISLDWLLPCGWTPNPPWSSLWWPMDKHGGLTCVYGPRQCFKAFVPTIVERNSCSVLGPVVVAGDFNLIYRSEDKNNPSIHYAMMGCFQRLLDDIELKESSLLGRKFTWSNERESPTLVKLDYVFCTAE